MKGLNPINNSLTRLILIALGAGAIVSCSQTDEPFAKFQTAKSKGELFTSSSELTFKLNDPDNLLIGSIITDRDYNITSVDLTVNHPMRADSLGMWSYSLEDSVLADLESNASFVVEDSKDDALIPITRLIQYHNKIRDFISSTRPGRSVGNQINDYDCTMKRVTGSEHELLGYSVTMSSVGDPNDKGDDGELKITYMLGTDGKKLKSLEISADKQSQIRNFLLEVSLDKLITKYLGGAYVPSDTLSAKKIADKYKTKVDIVSYKGKTLPTEGDGELSTSMLEKLTKTGDSILKFLGNPRGGDGTKCLTTQGAVKPAPYEKLNKGKQKEAQKRQYQQRRKANK